MSTKPVKTAASVSLMALSFLSITIASNLSQCALAQEVVAEIKVSADVVSKLKEMNTEEQAKYTQQLYYDEGIKVDLSGNTVVTQFVPIAEGTFLLNTLQLNEKQQEVYKQLNGYEEQQKFIQQITQDVSGKEFIVKGIDSKVDLGNEVTQIIPDVKVPDMNEVNFEIVKNPVIGQDIPQVIVNSNPVVSNNNVNVENSQPTQVIVNSNPVVSNNNGSSNSITNASSNNTFLNPSLRSSSTVVNFSVQGGLNATASDSGRGNSLSTNDSHPGQTTAETPRDAFKATSSVSSKPSTVGMVTESSLLKLGRLVSVEGVSGNTITVTDFIKSAVNTSGIVNMTAMNRMQPITNVLMTQDSIVEKSTAQAPVSVPVFNSPEPTSGQGFTATTTRTLINTQLIEMQEQLK